MISHREYFKKCKIEGNCIDVNVTKLNVFLPMPSIPHKGFEKIPTTKIRSILVCIKHQSICSSHVCKNERQNIS